MLFLIVIHLASSKADKYRRPPIRVLNRMRELWHMYKTLTGAYLQPTKDMLCSEKYREESPTSLWAHLPATNSDWASLVRRQYEEREKICKTLCVKRNMQCGGPEYNAIVLKTMPLLQVSDIGQKAWNYLKGFAKRDILEAFYVPEVFRALGSTERADDPNYLIPTIVLG